MPERKTTKKAVTKKSTAKKTATSKGWTAEEKAAAKAYAQERKAAERGENDERAVLAAIAKMEGSDREMAERIHDLIKKTAPELAPRTWYGMPAYAKDGKVLCFFRDARKFKERYAMLGFNDSAKLDDGAMWPIAYALTKLTKADEAKIAKLVKQAVS